jgi:hypothetical protein
MNSSFRKRLFVVAKVLDQVANSVVVADGPGNAREKISAEVASLEAKLKPMYKELKTLLLRYDFLKEQLNKLDKQKALPKRAPEKDPHDISDILTRIDNLYKDK